MSRTRQLKKITHFLVDSLGSDFCDDCAENKDRCLRISGVVDENVVYSTVKDKWFYLKDYNGGKTPVRYERGYVDGHYKIEFRLPLNKGNIPRSYFLNPESGKWSLDGLGTEVSSSEEQKLFTSLEDAVYNSSKVLKKYKKSGKKVARLIAKRITDPEYRNKK